MGYSVRCELSFNVANVTMMLSGYTQGIAATLEILVLCRLDRLVCA